MLARLLACAITLATVASASSYADDIATLPLGDPAKAYTLGSGDAGQLISNLGAAAAPISLEALAAELAQADVVIVGEHHTNMEGHRTQWKIVEALAATGRPFALGMEFFELLDDAALAEYIAGRIDLPAMLDQTGWYDAGAYNFEYYRPMIETCRKHGAPVYGVNVPRDWVRTVSRQGPQALTDDQRAKVGDPGPVDEKHRYIINQMMGGLGAAMPQMFDGMYRGQTTWDSAMATSILRAHNAHKQAGTPRTIIVIVGSGHMSHGLAIPARLKAMDPTLNVRTIAPVQGTKPDEDDRVHPGFEKKETAVFSMGFADYVYILPDDGNATEYPDFGVRLEHPKGAASPTATPLLIAGVTPGSIAARAGLRKGDQVLSLSGESLTSPRHAGALLGTFRWNDRITWRIAREGAGELDIPMLVVAPTDIEGAWLKSRASSAILDFFDPLSDRSYADPKKQAAASVQARVVNFRDKPVRIDVVRSGVLEESWALDADGRPILGLYARPASDAAVRVVIERDSTGKVTSSKRFTAAGEEMKPPAPSANPHADLTK